MPKEIFWKKVSDTIKETTNIQYGKFSYEKHGDDPDLVWYKLYLYIGDKKFPLSSFIGETIVTGEVDDLHEMFSLVYDKGRCDAEKEDRPEWT